MLINNNMWNRQIKTCELNDPISIIIGEILGIGFILIMLLICIIIKFSMKCTCSKDIPVSYTHLTLPTNREV